MLVLFSSIMSSVNAVDAPWRIQNALSFPTWFSLSGQHRTRFENLGEQFRTTENGGDQVLVLRTLVLAEMDFDKIKFAAEMEDSRSYLGDDGTPLSASVVNPLELLQAYVDIPTNNLFLDGSKSHLRGGRMTMDVGSRRLVSRNRFRNAINAFTGADWQWTGPEKQQFRLFYTLPIQRRDSGNILDNDARFDKEHTGVRFWGVYYAPANLPWGDHREVYLFGLNEDDVKGWQTRNRDLYTPGFRIYREPAKNKFDYQIESVFQFGKSRSSTSAANVTDLDHFAHFQHIEVGYTFNANWSPQLLLQYDYASGDDDPDDNDNNRFDTLYGARRFDFGPTGIYGPFARSNLSTPGIRLKLKPDANLTSFISLRGFWLADDDDAWTTTGIRNAPGESDSYIASQIEIRVRWELIPKNLRIEGGVAYLFAGDLMDNAGKDDTTYFYTQAVVWF